MSIGDLQAAVDNTSIRETPDDWALAAYRLAVARSEAATRPEDVRSALELLEKAAQILTADRAPVEHARILTAVGSCQRAVGRPARALRLFEDAARLLAGRVSLTEQGAALVNVGLAQHETGNPGAAIEALDQAIDLLKGTGRDMFPPPTGFDAPHVRGVATGGSDPHRGSSGGAGPGGHDDDDDERGRLLGAALINRAQALQALGTDADIARAIDDYQGALDALVPGSLQSAMANHGLGAAVLELSRRGAAGWPVGRAIEAFERSLQVLSHANFPFHHAVARHSLGLAYEMRGADGDLARAVNSLQASVSMFDPRLHSVHWRTAHAALSRVEAALRRQSPNRDRHHHVATLLTSTSDSEREYMLRDRLLRASALPAAALRADLDTLISSLAALNIEDYSVVLHSLIGVLMELPETVVEAACLVFCDVHRRRDSREALDAALDDVITARLFGPQRVRTRDLLEAGGWVRP